jgi:hypothetical protein
MKISKSQSIYISVVLVICLYLIALNNIQFYYLKNEPALVNTSFLNKYKKSGLYVINNNIAQYSVYLSRNHDDESKYRIEAYLFFNSKSLDEKYKIENYICLVKLLNLKTYLASNEEIIETNSVGTQSYYFDTNGKFIFEFSKNDFYSYKIDAKNFDIKNIVIGVIRREDYRKNMSEIEFNMKLNWEDIYLYERISFPYSLINYQQPKLVYNGKDLLKTVSSCVHFTYGRVASYLHN